MKDEIFRYIFFAVVASIVNVVVYLLTFEFTFQSILISNVIAYLISNIFSFYANKKYVFKNHDKAFYQIGLFIFVKFSAFLIDSFVLFIFCDVFGVVSVISKIISNCSTTVSNYALNKKIVFREIEG